MAKFASSLGGIHKLCWQNFEEFWPPPPSLTNKGGEGQQMSKFMVYLWHLADPLFPLLDNVVYGCPQSVYCYGNLNVTLEYFNYVRSAREWNQYKDQL